MGKRRPLVVTIAAAAVVVCGAAAVDAVSASTVEADLSTRIRPATPGVSAPAVLLGGGPTGRWSAPGILSSVSIRAEGVERPGLGPVTVEAEATDLPVPEDRAAALTAGSVRVSVQLTGATLGPLLGMRDVVVGAADDPTLAGGTEDRARVTGTLEDSGARVSGIVRLVVDARGVHLVPEEAATGPARPAGQDPALALRRTALTLPPDALPLGLSVESFTARGGTLTASGSGGSGTAPLGDLARADL